MEVGSHFQIMALGKGSALQIGYCNVIYMYLSLAVSHNPFVRQMLGCSSYNCITLLNGTGLDAMHVMSFHSLVAIAFVVVHVNLALTFSTIDQSSSNA